MHPLPERDLQEAADQAAAFWPDLEGKRLLLTGMTGPIGLWTLSVLDLLERTVGLAYSATVVSRDPSRFLTRHPHFRSSRAITWLTGDIRRIELPQVPYDFVIHGATTRAEDTFRGESASEKFDTVVRGTENVLHQLPVGAGTRLLFVSSGSVYGTSLLPEGTLIPQGWPEAPALTEGNALGHAKRAAEYRVLTFHEERLDITALVARCFSFVGPGLPTDFHYALGNFLAAALEKRDIVVRSSGSAIRSYLYFGDMVAWLLGSLIAGTHGSIYHIGSESGISIRDLAHLVRELAGSGSRVVIQGSDCHEPKTSAPQFYVPDTRLTRGALDVAERTPLAEGVLRTANFLRRGGRLNR